jgi:hypothetical protein
MTHTFPTREQLAILFLVVLPIMLMAAPIETLHAWRQS